MQAISATYKENASKKLVFIVNPFSGLGQKRALPNRLHRLLDHEKYSFTIQFTEYPGHATLLAAEAVAAGANMIVAVGGDGSVNEVASALVGTETVLGILPAGSGNGFATHLGLGRNIDKAIKTLNEGHEITIDTCRLNDRPFFNLAGVGFDAQVAYRTKQSRFRGFWPYLKYALAEATTYRAANYQLHIDGKVMERECMIIAIANAPMYGYQFRIAPLAQLNDGLMEVMLLRKAPLWRYCFSAWRALNGSLHRSRLAEHMQARVIQIRLPKPSPVHVDGEGFWEEQDLQFSILPASLKVWVPSSQRTSNLPA